MSAISKMFRSWSILAFSLALVLPASAESPELPPAYLDRPLPPDLKLDSVSAPPLAGKGPDIEFPSLKITSFHQAMGLLETITEKKILLPPELATWPNEDSESNWGFSFGVTKEMKVKELLKRLCETLNLTWREDLEKNALVLDFKWHRKDSRPTRELANVLVQTKPLPWEKLLQNVPNGVGGRNIALDDWRLAFDALISKPENFSTAGTLRLYFNSHGKEPGLCPFPTMNLLVEKLQNRGGRAAILVINQQVPFTNKEVPGDIAYYLFDEEGRFIRGGVYAMGESGGAIVKAQVDPDQIVTIDVGWGSFAMNPDHIHFAVLQDDLVLQGSTDFQGKPRNAAETMAKFPAPSNGGGFRLKYQIAGKDSGSGW